MAKAKTENISGAIKVEILVSVAGVGFAYKKGDIVELSIEQSQDFIKAGYAKEAK